LKEEIWKEIRKYGLRLARRGYVAAHGGNISIRIGSKMYITRHACSLENITLNDIVTTYVDKPSSFDSVASTDTTIHREIYKQTQHLAVIHAHTPYAVALSFFADEIIPEDVEGNYIMKKIPVVEGKVGDLKLAKRVAKVLKTYYAVIVRGHGVFAGAEHLDEAYHFICMVEHSCKILYLIKSLKNMGETYIKPKEF